MAVTSVASSGVGDITLGAALSGGYQTAATAYGANANIDIRVEEGDTFEVCRDCTYTHSGTTVNRGTLEDGSSGTATRVAFTSAAKVYVIESAERIGRHNAMLQSATPGGRLTLTTNVPVTTSDVTDAATIYYTPYVHNIINLWDGVDWVPTTFTEKSLAIGTVTASLPYDVFGYLSAGDLVLEKLAWTDGATRATAVSLQDGRYCKTGDKTRLLLGTFYSASTTTTEDSVAKRFLCNLYNCVDKICKGETTASHTYTTSTVREWNAGTSTTRAMFINCVNDYVAEARLYANLTAESAIKCGIAGLSLNSTTLLGDGIMLQVYGTDLRSTVSDLISITPGYSYVAITEYGINSVTYASANVKVAIKC